MIWFRFHVLDKFISLLTVVLNLWFDLVGFKNLRTQLLHATMPTSIQNTNKSDTSWLHSAFHHLSEHLCSLDAFSIEQKPRGHSVIRGDSLFFHPLDLTQAPPHQWLRMHPIPFPPHTNASIGQALMLPPENKQIKYKQYLVIPFSPTYECIHRPCSNAPT